MPIAVVHAAAYRIELMTVNPLAHLPEAQTARCAAMITRRTSESRGTRQFLALKTRSFESVHVQTSGHGTHMGMERVTSYLTSPRRNCFVFAAV
jgi:hypothetical protein